MRSSALFSLVFAVALAAPGAVSALPSTGSTDPHDARARIGALLGSLPMDFVENRGQTDAQVRYYAQDRQKTIYFTSSGLTFAFTRPLQTASARLDTTDESARRWALKLDFVGADRGVKPRAYDPSPAVVSYFHGPRAQWKTGLETYRSIVYADLWPGIDLVLSASVDRLKYRFVVKEGADPSRIRLAYRGASAMRVSDVGTLDVETPNGSLRDEKPYAYQDVDGARVPVNTAYHLDGKRADGAQSYGFAVAAYDVSHPLVIDPAIVMYAGYLGGSDDDFGYGVAVDAAGNAYVTGAAVSTETSFPVTAGPDLTQNGGDFDAFVAKVKADGTGLVYCGYIGGSGDDDAYAIAVDDSGNAYVTGDTTSSEASFPATVGPDLTYNGAVDAFVAKINASGTGLVYAGYIGGADDDYGSGIAVDSGGNAYVVGSANSTEATFPVAVGPDLTLNSASYPGDAFAAKVKANGTGLAYAGYIGGSGATVAYDVAVDGAGNAYVVGATTSTETSFPVAVGPDLTYNGGRSDAFVAKIKTDGSALSYAGYVGGSGEDSGLGIALDGAGNAYIAGLTSSTEATFPVSIGPDLTYNGGDHDAFVAKVTTNGSALAYAGYVGGADDDRGAGIAVDSAGSAYVTGTTASTGATFPLLEWGGANSRGAYDAFVSRVKPNGSGLISSGFIGGSDLDGAAGIAVDAAGNAYVIGTTLSSDATFPVTVGPDLTSNGNRDAFVVKINAGAPPGCFDDMKDVHETDVDCGGGACAPCGAGQECRADSDCQSGMCTLVGGPIDTRVVGHCEPLPIPPPERLYDPYWWLKWNPAAAVFVGNVFYAPAKLGFAALGAVASGVAFVATAGRTDAARAVWHMTTGGDYVITPANVARGATPRFVGGPQHDRSRSPFISKPQRP